jgi:4-oxalocrotonate tautomerase
MPYVNIKVTDENVTKEQKLTLIQTVTDILVEVLGKDPKTTHIVIDEVNTDNWGVNGNQYSEIKKNN